MADIYEYRTKEKRGQLGFGGGGIGEDTPNGLIIYRDSMELLCGAGSWSLVYVRVLHF